LKKLDGFSFHIGFRPTQIGTSSNQADDGRPSLYPQDHTEQRVAAELRTADDKLMTTQLSAAAWLHTSLTLSINILKSPRAACHDCG
jgi:hypothetical protein